MPNAERVKSITSAGFSVLDMLIVVVIVSIIVTYILGQISTIQKPLARTNAAQRLTAYVQTARSDSIRRHASEINRMAQITVVDAQGYNVSLDANGDGNLDPPVFVDLKDQNLKMDGPFPRMYMFDAQGRTVDPGRNPITSGAITLSNGSGKSVINLVNPTLPANSGSSR
ncbi:MAG TPA: GspH/FimT family protein [Pyrinomonadaceae bacterium]|nr:GspH/FimT family protein [Pyrinomonadaceae bacterium]